MKKLYIINIKEGSSSVYGIGTYLNELAKSVMQIRKNVCIIHIKSETQKFTEVVENGITHWHIPQSRIKYKDIEKQNQLYFSNVIFFLRQQIQPADQIVFHLNVFDYPYFINALKDTFNCKIVHAVHYLSWCFHIGGNVSRLKKIIKKPEDQLNTIEKKVIQSFSTEKQLLCSADHVISLSKNTSGILQQIYGVKNNNISLIYNGLEDGRPNMDKQMIRKKYHIPDNIPIIFFAGRMADVKGLNYALRAFKKVLENKTTCHLIIAGGHGDFDAYLKECEDIWMHVTWTGLLGKEKLYEFYSIADIGVIPSFHEQCSCVAIEMMMHGVPLIASTTTGLKEMVEEGVTGLHIPVIEHLDKVEIDSLVLAEKMQYLLQHPAERKRMGANARRRYESVYSASMFRKNMLDFYQSLFHSADL